MTHREAEGRLDEIRQRAKETRRAAAVGPSEQWAMISAARAKEICDDVLALVECVAVLERERDAFREAEFDARGEMLAMKAKLRRAEEALREVIGECAPPVEALLAVHSDGKWIAPTTVDGLRSASEALRKNVAALSKADRELAS